MNTLTIGIDTEDNAGQPTIYALAHALGFKSWTAGAVGQDDLIRELNKLAQSFDAVNIWCLNLPYDLVNLFGELMPDILTVYLARRRIVGAQLKGQSKVKFFALERFLPKINLAKIGKMVGLEKLEIEFNEKRCIRDAQIAARAGDRISREMQRMKIPLRFSPVAGALAAFHAEAGSKLPVCDERVRGAGKDALYGGRTETYYIGYWPETKGQLFYFDFRAAHAKAMLELLPDYTSFNWTDKPEETFYLADVLVEVTPWHGMGTLPYHDHDRGLIFPVGTFRGTYTDEDLKGPNIKVLKYYGALNFPRAGRYLKHFTKKLIPTPMDNPINRALKKGIYTGMSGKFSQRSEISFFMDWEKAKPADFWNGIMLGDWVLANRKGPTPRHSNFVWSAYITAKCRRMQRQLYEAIFKEGGKVLYGDTDSGLACLDSVMRAKRLLANFDAELSMKEITEARIFSPKMYVFRDKEGVNHISAKGIPGRLHDQIAEGHLELEADQPGTFWELLKANAANRMTGLKNSWVRKSYTVNSNFKSRILPRRGPWTAPVVMTY